MEYARTWAGTPARRSWVVNRLMIFYFKVICCICPCNNSIYTTRRTCRLGRVGYSTNVRAFGPRTPYQAVGLAGVAMCARVNNFSRSPMIVISKRHHCYFDLCLFILDKRNTLWLRDIRPGRHPEVSQPPPGSPKVFLSYTVNALFRNTSTVAFECK